MNFFSIRYTGRYTDLTVSIFRHKSPKPKLYWTPFVDLLLGPIRGVHFKKLGPIIITKKRWPIRGSNYIRRKNEIFHFALFELRTLTINSSDDSKFMFKKCYKTKKKGNTIIRITLLFHDGADDGNRTRVISLEGWSSTIELRLQKRLDYFILVRFK